MSNDAALTTLGRGSCAFGVTHGSDQVLGRGESVSHMKWQG